MDSNLSEILKKYLTEFLTNHHQHISNLHGACIEEMERVLIEVMMHHTNGNQVQAAKMLGVNRSTLRRKIIEFRMDNLLTKVS